MDSNPILAALLSPLLSSIDVDLAIVCVLNSDGVAWKLMYLDQILTGLGLVLCGLSSIDLSNSFAHLTILLQLAFLPWSPTFFQA